MAHLQTLITKLFSGSSSQCTKDLAVESSNAPSYIMRPPLILFMIYRRSFSDLSRIIPGSIDRWIVTRSDFPVVLDLKTFGRVRRPYNVLLACGGRPSAQSGFTDKSIGITT